MKKFVTMMLTLCLLAATLSVACAAAVNFQPAALGDGSNGYVCSVDAENGIGSAEITFTPYQKNEYKTAEIAALKAGDTVMSFDEEITVETVEAFENGWHVNAGFIDGGATFEKSASNPDVCYSCGYDDQVFRSEGAAMTLPMAEQVLVSTYRMNDGAYDGESDEVTMPAAEVRDYLLELADPDDEDAISLYADFCLYVENGAVTKIELLWAPNV